MFLEDEEDLSEDLDVDDLEMNEDDKRKISALNCTTNT